MLFKDGITESMGKEGKLFGEDRLINLIESWGDRPAVVIHAAILEELESYEKPDDVTLLVMKRL